jgi:hypothetical protein
MISTDDPGVSLENIKWDVNHFSNNQRLDTVGDKWMTGFSPGRSLLRKCAYSDRASLL